jgi:hypothetical protein
MDFEPMKRSRELENRMPRIRELKNKTERIREIVGPPPKDVSDE